MLKKPVLAKCNNRNQLAKTGSTQAIIESLFHNDHLKKIGYSAIDFDFFIDWSSFSLSNEVWVKRILNPPYNVNNLSLEALFDHIKTVDTPRFIRSMICFAQNKDLTFKYKIFPDKPESYWLENAAHDSKEILEVEVTSKGFTNINYQSIGELAAQIQRLSGGSMRIGSKGLFYSTSTLECYFSKTDTPWPGDADNIIMDVQSRAPILLIELKKHTLAHQSIEEHTYDKYYQGRDRRKYHRLALLANHLDIPFMILYYSTHQQDFIIVDKLDVEITHHTFDFSLKSRDKIKLPQNDAEYEQMIRYFLQD